MKDNLNAHKLGLVLGIVFAFMHFLWILLVASGFAKSFMDYAISLHFMNDIYSINAFSLGTAAMLLVFTFVAGYIIGSIFAWTWNKIHI